MYLLRLHIFILLLHIFFFIFQGFFFVRTVADSLARTTKSKQKKKTSKLLNKRHVVHQHDHPYMVYSYVHNMLRMFLLKMDGVLCRRVKVVATLTAPPLSLYFAVECAELCGASNTR